MRAAGTAVHPPARELTIARVFDAPRELVFEAWSRSEHLMRWFCPSGFGVPECVCEFRVGGQFIVCMRSADGEDHWSRGRYTEIIAPERIAFTSTVSVGDGERLYGTETRVDFAADGARTRLVVRQRLTLFEPSADWMIVAVKPGWRDGLDKLKTLIAEMKEQAQ